MVDGQYLRATLHQCYILSISMHIYTHTHTHAFLSTHTWICPWVDSFWQCMSLISFWECLSIIAFPKISRHHSHQGAFQSVTICHFRCGTSTTRNQSIELFGTPVPCCGLIVGATLKYVLHSPILVSPPHPAIPIPYSRWVFTWPTPQRANKLI